MPAARDSNGRSQARAKGAGRAALTARKGHSGKLPDVTALSDAELEALGESIDREREARRALEREKFFASMRERARQLGVQPAELAAELSRTVTRRISEKRISEKRISEKRISEKRISEKLVSEGRASEGRASEGRVADGRAKVAPKYRNPADAEETWAGRGVKPKWLQALLAQGRSMDEFKIAP